MIKTFKQVLLVAGLTLTFSTVVTSEPIKLHPDNNRYFIYKGKPTVLITSNEHYGAVLNKDFDYIAYLDELKNKGLNYTLIFTGTYIEPAENIATDTFRWWNIDNNTLGPTNNNFLCPWARSTTQKGFAGDPNSYKFDLSKWDDAGTPANSYFPRLRDFIKQADDRGIAVVIVFFLPFNEASFGKMWERSPMNGGSGIKNGLPGVGNDIDGISNNVNNAGNIAYLTSTGDDSIWDIRDNGLHNDGLTVYMSSMVTKIVQELNEFDNVIYQSIGESWFGGGTRGIEFDNYIISKFVTTEAALPKKHLICQARDIGWAPNFNINPNASLFFYSGPPLNTIVKNYFHNIPIGVDEITYLGIADVSYRCFGWKWIMAGGAVYAVLDLTFTPGPGGGSGLKVLPYYTSRYDYFTNKSLSFTIGGGGPALRTQMGVLKSFMDSFDFVNMHPDNSIITGALPSGTTAWALVQDGKQYAIYIQGNIPSLNVNLQGVTGTYKVEWINTKTGNIDKTETFSHTGGTKVLTPPSYTEDIALRILSNVTPNTAPTVNLQKPTNGQSFTTGSNILIEATASDDGAVTKVDFYNGSNFLGTDNSSPYNYTWNSVSKGNYTISVVATDNGSPALTGTAQVSIVVTDSGNASPTASITAPSNGATYKIGDLVTISGTAYDSDGTITNVKIYAGSSLIGIINVSPYTITWSTTAAANYSLTAVATDDKGATGTSPAVTITVTPEGKINLALGKTATASSVETGWGNDNASYAVDGDMGTRWASQYPYSDTEWIYVDLGATYNITEVILKWEAAYGANYQIQVSDNHTDWTTIATKTGGTGGTDDIIPSISGSGRYVRMNGIARGPYGYSLYEFEIYGTLVGGNRPPTTSITAPTNGATYNTGTLVTISGTANDTDGTISNVKFYAGTTLLGTDTSSPYSITWTPTVASSYNLTAVATDNGNATGTSSVVTITVTNPANASPTASITAPTNGTTYNTGDLVTISGSANDSDGTIANVKFYAGSTLIGTDNVSPYTITWTPTVAASYNLTTVATDNGNATGTSSVVTITVSADTTSPVISGVTPTTITGNEAVIIWTTNEPSDSQVAYGLTTAMGSTTTLNAALLTNHNVTLSNLKKGKTYYYRIYSRDSSGNLATSSQYSFKTSNNIRQSIYTYYYDDGTTTVATKVGASPSMSLKFKLQVYNLDLGENIIATDYTGTITLKTKNSNGEELDTVDTTLIETDAGEKEVSVPFNSNINTVELTGDVTAPILIKFSDMYIAKLVGYQGGSIRGANGLKIIIPTGVLSANKYLASIRTSAVPSANNTMKYVNTVNPICYDFGELTFNNNTPMLLNQNFTRAVNITIPYASADIGTLKEDGLRIYYWTGSDWEIVTGVQTVDKTNKTVTAKVNHFSTYRILGSYLSVDLSNVRVYPNPYNFTTAVQGKLKVINLPINSIMKLYSVDGELVRELKELDYGNLGRIEWDGKDGNGDKVGRGVYIYQVEDAAGKKKTGKIGLVK
ncbi:MAG: Ig-like domain-containing protein [Elusimicrobia bacterium]|nr:Ig-like domain-containing protein [Elusimicrobiota bacterium]